MALDESCNISHHFSCLTGNLVAQVTPGISFLETNLKEKQSVVFAVCLKSEKAWEGSRQFEFELVIQVIGTAEIT